MIDRKKIEELGLPDKYSLPLTFDELIWLSQLLNGLTATGTKEYLRQFVGLCDKVDGMVPKPVREMIERSKAAEQLAAQGPISQIQPLSPVDQAQQVNGKRPFRKRRG